jgi:Alcohol dehydrogenase GroES-like domain/Transposase DDE domain
VIEVGSEVTRFKAGDHVAVGCMVNSCQHCDQCRNGEEQFCREGNTMTYGGFNRMTQKTIQAARLLQACRDASGVRPACARRARPPPGRSTAMCRHHNLFAPAHLESWPGQHTVVAPRAVRSLRGTPAFERSRQGRKRIEMLFAPLKRILKIGRLRLRGPCGAQDEFLLAATAQNLRKLANLVTSPGSQMTQRA